MTEECGVCGATLPKGRLSACPRCFLGDADEFKHSIELHEQIGLGGMARVYRGHHRRLDRTVAVKMLSDELALDEDFRRRFEREAQILAGLDHPHIVTVFDGMELDGVPCIVMEFLSGGTLLDRLPLPMANVIDVMERIVDAVAYAHDRGVIHRDLKPSNVLFDDRGRPKVADFGIARLLAGDPRLTSTGVATGTPLYMAPEALLGKEPDPRMDVWSLGVMLQQAITGEIASSPLPEVPEPFAAIVRRALSRDPLARHETAASFHDELHAARTIPLDDGLPAHERTWMLASAFVQSVAIAVAFFAFLESVRPKVLARSEVGPLVVVATEELADGRIVSRARFEFGWTIAAFLAFAAAVSSYGLLRQRWYRLGLERIQPDRAVRESRTVLRLGVFAVVVDLVRLLLNVLGLEAITVYAPVLGGLLEVVILLFFMMVVLECHRTHRPLMQERRALVGMVLAAIPPTLELLRYLKAWRPS